MAVRDEEVAGARDQATQQWKDALGHLPGVLLVGGLLMYAYLSICYDRFYGSLGIDPNDVGLSYTGTLPRSSGFAVTTISLVASVLVGYWFHRRNRPRQTPAIRSFLFLFGTYLLIGMLLYLPLRGRCTM